MCSQTKFTLAQCGPQVEALRDIGELFYQRGWSLGTSSNYSVVLRSQPLYLLVTASGRDKRCLRNDDFVIVDENGQAIEAGSARPSAETLLHLVIAKQPGVGAVLHTHSVFATVLSEAHFAEQEVSIAGYEMLKGLSGIITHDTCVRIAIFDNTQDMQTLSTQVADRLTDSKHPLRYGFLIRGHGLYSWGRDLAEARRHVEILEFLFETLVRRASYKP